MTYLADKLPDKLVYHDINHSLFVLENIEKIIVEETVNQKEKTLLQTAALLHDIGFTETYKNHEEKSCQIALKYLPEFGYTDSEIHQICQMIRATKIPQKPQNQLEKILADADLLYLGTKHYDFVSNKLLKEMNAYSFILNEEEWVRLQIDFLENHSFHTQFCIKNFEIQKNKTLSILKKKYIICQTQTTR